MTRFHTRSARAAIALVAVALLLGAVARAGDAPGDLRFAPTPGSSFAGSIFPHWVHRLRFTCSACHPALFPMARKMETTMDQILAGEGCGSCHNGRVAFPVTPETCNRCHVPAEP